MSVAAAISAARTLGALGLAGPPAAGAAADPATPVRGITEDSRAVRPGFVFVAVAGTRQDGARFIPEAIAKGAVAIVTGRGGLEFVRRAVGEPSVPVHFAEEPRAALARLAAAFHGAQPEVVAAVTGTNGKTSVTCFLRQIWERAGYSAAALGTTGVLAPGLPAEPLLHTTPDAVTLHALLARLARGGISHVAIEASSHGLAQYRLDGVRLAAGAFTNLTRDHLDYHATAEEYRAAKLRLFAECLPEGAAAVLNIDDPVGREAAGMARARGLRVIGVGSDGRADLAILEAAPERRGQRLRLRWQGVEHTAELALIGSFQAVNVAIAAGLALATGMPAEEVFTALPHLAGARGRMEEVARRANGARIYVDYAHTPDALANAIAALRPHCRGRLVVVFGAGGDRDPGKRPLMGRAVAEAADVAIVTDDNPRSEDPAAIRRAIIAACPGAHEIGDRRAAILAGVDMLSGPEDCLLIAGKGHEQGQIVGTRTIPFDDAEAARSAVAALDSAAAALGGGR